MVGTYAKRTTVHTCNSKSRNTQLAEVTLLSQNTSVGVYGQIWGSIFCVVGFTVQFCGNLGLGLRFFGVRVWCAGLGFRVQGPGTEGRI